MPKEEDFEPIPRRQQNIYIIQDCSGSSDSPGAFRKQYIDALIKRLQGEAEYHPEIAFHLCLTVYQDSHTWGHDAFSLDPDDPPNIPALPYIGAHEQSVWDDLSQMISDTAKRYRSIGLISYLPIFIFFVNQNNNLASAKHGKDSLSSNPYFLISISNNRRLIICSDSVWDNNRKTDQFGTPYEMDLIYPYSLFSTEVLDHFLRIPQKMYQSGELASELIALHKPDMSANIPNDVTDSSDNRSDDPW